jgi:DNA-binding XRE family transcriptional regulator
MYYKLKGKRVEKGLTQEDISKKLNIDKSAYARKENGQVQFRLDEVKKILEILNCNFEDIFLDKK